MQLQLQLLQQQRQQQQRRRRRHINCCDWLRCAALRLSNGNILHIDKPDPAATATAAAGSAAAAACAAAALTRPPFNGISQIQIAWHPFSAHQIQIQVQQQPRGKSIPGQQLWHTFSQPGAAVWQAGSQGSRESRLGNGSNILCKMQRAQDNLSPNDVLF